MPCGPSWVLMGPEQRLHLAVPSAWESSFPGAAPDRLSPSEAQGLKCPLAVGPPQTCEEQMWTLGKEHLGYILRLVGRYSTRTAGGHGIQAGIAN